jgi:hypothetical protein
MQKPCMSLIMQSASDDMVLGRQPSWLKEPWSLQERCRRPATVGRHGLSWPIMILEAAI